MRPFHLDPLRKYPFLLFLTLYREVTYHVSHFARSYKGEEVCTLASLQRRDEEG